MLQDTLNVGMGYVIWLPEIERYYAGMGKVSESKPWIFITRKYAEMILEEIGMNGVIQCLK